MSQPIFTGPDGLTVQAIGVNGSAEYLVKRRGYWVWYWEGRDKRRNPRTLAELATLVDLGELSAP